ncbi:MAG TPA: hypothetical protein VGB42_01385 [Candidatus Thermoplasmatota archaeon]
MEGDGAAPGEEGWKATGKRVLQARSRTLTRATPARAALSLRDACASPRSRARPARVWRRLEKGTLQTVHRGVYRTGPVTARYEREMAAVRACGELAVLSHRSAAALWELCAPPGPDEPVDVTGPRGLRRRSGLRIHRVRGLRPDEADLRHGLPLTVPSRTLLDLAACAETQLLERAVARAERTSSSRGTRSKPSSPGIPGGAAVGG